jgi:EpsI family protein
MTAPHPWRSLVLAACLGAAAVAIGQASRVERVPPRESLERFPMAIGEWHGQSADRFDQRVLTALGVDEYISRIYSEAAGQTAGLYIGYYQSQREGNTMHSPLNCLPGAGWQPVVKEHIRIPVLDQPTVVGRPDVRREIEVNRFVIQKGGDRQIVIYWYQSRERVVASEYWGKVFTVLDALRTNRTDAAMVRVVCSIAGPTADAERRANAAAIAFTQEVFPLLSRYLPR